ncbi:hypothetical protein GCM10011611_41070 [Aliidongia dinghuensis]|uniref:Uncharacterized protein n=1 Tax=Aliidongia dinghuensis TaxID=1867774 RepID=A0A8J2YX38_9PROT|nr:hypothetical protein [Aliidongia dinghuensis]GGF30759.1 hypothetical protein GCM10011611_41070 [Aliidongia dinghuensis]
MKRSPSFCVHACLVGAALVLTSARGLWRLGLIGPRQIGTALGWSDRLTRHAMALRRRHRAKGLADQGHHRKVTKIGDR